jgi:hypothetical protein
MNQYVSSRVGVLLTKIFGSPLAGFRAVTTYPIEPLALIAAEC